MNFSKWASWLLSAALFLAVVVFCWVTAEMEEITLRRAAESRTGEYRHTPFEFHGCRYARIEFADSMHPIVLHDPECPACRTRVLKRLDQTVEACDQWWMPDQLCRFDKTPGKR